ncbi:MAG: ATP-dependent zinc metalloprotease FtsH [Chloroflexi bacterium]|nr:ATP-dependent zinc metalloprotease FtsH [Chloroflexota bacterium]
MADNKWLRNSFVYLIIFVAVIALWFTIVNPPSSEAQMTLNQLVAKTKVGEIAKITSTEGSNRMSVQVRGEQREQVVTRPDGVTIVDLMNEAGIPASEWPALETRPASQWGSWISTLSFILPTLFLIGIFIFMMRQAQGSNNQAMSFGKSRARMFTGNKPTVTFADVAGVEEAKTELAEVVEFLKYPDKFAALGARIPKGCLLVGPPGTGKTLLSRAVAGEAGVPFFSISGSEFVEMFVGVGASRVRDLFDQAKRNAPCIVFIDEIDAVGRQRGAGLGGSHDEREQTLNQILVEMDGFDGNTNVIVIAATNRPDVLDPALLRPGRFDRQVVLDRPDIKGRQAILEVHSRGKPLDETIALADLAKQTPGFSGADLENLINEAAIQAARRNRKTIGKDEIAEAIDRVIAGPQRRSRVISDRERIMTAYHEAGHALVARMLPHSDPVHKVSIIARGMMGGYTRVLPDEDRLFWTRSQFKDMLAYALGGYVAEKLVFNELSTGAGNDIERASNVARRMVTEFGMSDELGPLALGKKEELVFLGREISEQRNYSDEVAYKIDQEIRRLIDEAYDRAEAVLNLHMDKLKSIADLLIERETIDSDEMEALFTTPRPTPELYGPPYTDVPVTQAARSITPDANPTIESPPAAPSPPRLHPGPQPA